MPSSDDGLKVNKMKIKMWIDVGNISNVGHSKTLRIRGAEGSEVRV
jgi:hypothetical protein